ncbi:hypothetical protein BYT27DRAFT_7196147 [Phlegmacium glaucopus]|nr:hypothetical protein BYT27DRAFT_7196147 [Phlegmacium glaucopus]
MQTSSDQPSRNIIKKYAGNVALAAENADPDKWEWDNRTGWTSAMQYWQDFRTKWHGATDLASLVDPESRISPSLALEPLPSNITCDLPSVLVRKSYVSVFDHIWAQAMISKGKHGAIVTGQPGIGKTLFQYYLLIRLLQLKQVVLFTLNGEDLLLFYHNEVHQAVLGDIRREVLPQAKSQSSNIFIWSLFDIEGQNEPKGILVRPPCLPVQTASPNPSRYKTWYKERAPLFTALPLWTHDELMKGLPYQERYHSLMSVLQNLYPSSSADQDDEQLDEFPGARALLREYEKECEEACEEEEEEEGGLPSAEGALDYILKAAIDRFGFSARDVFSAVFNYETTTRDHENAFNMNYDELLAIVSALARDQSPMHSTSHKILALSPVYSGPFVRVDWDIRFKSEWVGRSVLQRTGVAEDVALRHLIRTLQRYPATQTLAGQLHEPFAHRSIAQFTGGTWPLIKMTSDDADPPHFTIFRDASPPVCDDVQFQKVEREIVSFESITNCSEWKNDKYYIPVDPMFPLFDAFTIDIDYSKKSAILWIFQVTTSRLHGGSAKGYATIRNIIASLKDQLRENSLPKKTRKMSDKQTAAKPLVEVHYILVVPNGRSQLQWNFPKGWNMSCERNDHRGPVYCWEIPLVVVRSSIIQNILCLNSSLLWYSEISL